MYGPNETGISKRYLEAVFRQLKDDVCLLGGWAAYYVVNENFEKATGRSYIGSRDIDIGFYIDKNWTDDQLKKSAFSSAIENLKKLGFYGMSFRLAKDFESETAKELKPEEAKKLQSYQIFQLCVDLIVDFIHPNIKQIFKFSPIDEPLLSLVFGNGLCTVQNVFGTRVLLPEPQVLLAMKLKSVVNRTKDDKRIKDISDIYALLWYSDMDVTRLNALPPSIYSKDEVRRVVKTFSNEEIRHVSVALGIKEPEIAKVLAKLT